MSYKNPIIAICYDFDGTLAPGNMHEHSILPEFGIKKEYFWKEVGEFAKRNNMNEVLAYMFLTLKKAEEKDLPVKYEAFLNHGKKIQMFQGVKEYFRNINQYAKNKKCVVEHYIISSGLKEIIEGTEIKNELKYIFASGYYYDVNKVAKWPALAIDYTAKTQYLFRINKGTLEVWDNSRINKYTPENERHVPFSRMIYIGDGETDIPAMKMINYQGGYSIAVYDPNKRSTKNKKSPKDICKDLIKHGRATFIAPADYKDGSYLTILIKNLIDKIVKEYEITELKEKMIKKTNKD